MMCMVMWSVLSVDNVRGAVRRRWAWRCVRCAAWHSTHTDRTGACPTTTTPPLSTTAGTWRAVRSAPVAGAVCGALHDTGRARTTQGRACRTRHAVRRRTTGADRCRCDRRGRMCAELLMDGPLSPERCAVRCTARTTQRRVRHTRHAVRRRTTGADRRRCSRRGGMGAELFTDSPMSPERRDLWCHRGREDISDAAARRSGWGSAHDAGRSISPAYALRSASWITCATQAGVRSDGRDRPRTRDVAHPPAHGTRRDGVVGGHPGTCACAVLCDPESQTTSPVQGTCAALRSAARAARKPALSSLYPSAETGAFRLSLFRHTHVHTVALS